MIEEQTQENISVALYGRVSSSNQENEGTIETQIAAMKQFALTKGYTIVREYLDNGWSGDGIVRPELDKLRVDAKRKLWNAVLVYDPDRLARRYSYQELIMDELREAGKQVLFVTTPTPTNSIEKILYGVQGLFAEYERAKIAERFRLGKVRKANEGHIISSEGPFGYTFIKRTGNKGDSDFKQGYYEINEKEAEVVRMIFSWVADEGLTMRGIIVRLQQLGIQPRKSVRGVWGTSTLSTLLRNKTYIGEAHFGASMAVVPVKPIKKDIYRKIKKSSRKIRPESEWIKIKVPAILERDLFERANARLKINYQSLSRNKKNPYLLAGKIWCVCGTRRGGEGSLHGKHLYYRCSSRVYSFPLKSKCKEAGINARIADSLVWETITQLLVSPKEIRAQLSRWSEKKTGSKQSAEENINPLKIEIGKLQEQLKRYTEAYSEKVLSINELKGYTAPIKEKISELEKQLSVKETTTSNSEGIVLDDKQIEVFTQKATEFLRDLSFSSKKVIIGNIIDKVVGTKDHIEFNGIIPINYFDYVVFQSNYRNSQDATQHSKEVVEIPFSIKKDLINGDMRSTNK